MLLTMQLYYKTIFFVHVIETKHSITLVIELQHAPQQHNPHQLLFAYWTGRKAFWWKWRHKTNIIIATHDKNMKKDISNDVVDANFGNMDSRLF